MAKKITHQDLDRLQEATTQALGLVVGLLAEAVGSRELAHHFSAAMHAQRRSRANPVTAALLQDAYRLVLIKARNAHPDDPALQALAASELGSLEKH